MDIKYSSTDELFALIKQINEKYYERFSANILFLEELCNKIFVIYIIQLRDAYSHLVRVFDFDVLSDQGKRNVQEHLSKYVNHLHNGILDTFRKILAMEFKFLMNVAPGRERKVIEYQVAKKAYDLRIMGRDISVDERIDGYIALLDYIAEIRAKFIKL
jgi:hypothetical protein